MSDSISKLADPPCQDQRLKFLNKQIARSIDQALCRIGEFGEVRLVIVKGQLRFIQIMQSTNVRSVGDDEEMLP